MVCFRVVFLLFKMSFLFGFGGLFWFLFPGSWIWLILVFGNLSLLVLVI